MSHYNLLGIEPGATPAEIKAAYHAKLREFPAHTYPQEFKAIREAYEVLRQGGSAQAVDFFKIQPMKAELDQTLLNQLRTKARSLLEVSLDDLIRATF